MRYIITVLLLTSCADKAIYVTNEKDGWFWVERKGLQFCKANNKDTSYAEPTCGQPTYYDLEMLKKKTK